MLGLEIVELEELGLEEEEEEHVEEGYEVEEPVRGEALLNPVGRRVRGAEAEQGDVASRLDPEVPVKLTAILCWMRMAGER